LPARSYFYPVAGLKFDFTNTGLNLKRFAAYIEHKLGAAVLAFDDVGDLCQQAFVTTHLQLIQHPLGA